MTPIDVAALVKRVHPVVQIHDGQPITTSVEVARVFGKRHNDVLRAIENLLPQLPPDHQRNFAQMIIENKIGKGATRKDPAYQLNRDAFAALAFGFTGKKAIVFRCAYIDAFNKMEAALAEQAQPASPASLPAPDAVIPDDVQTALNETGITPDMINEIVSSTTQNLVATLQQKRKLIHWQEVIEALQNPQTDMTFPDLTALLHACIARFERSVDSEAYLTIKRRAFNQRVSMADVSLNA